MKKQEFKNNVMLVLDVLFVLILCFAVLLVTMLVTRSSESDVFSGYHISIGKLAAVFAVIVAYMVFMLKVSIQGLRHLINKYYEK